MEHLTWAEVAEARIGGREPILRLEELLGAWPDVRFNLDIKAAGVLAPWCGSCARWTSPTASASVLLRRPDRGGPAPVRPDALHVAGPARCGRAAPSSYSPRAAGLVRIQAGCAQVPLQLGGRALVDERFVAAAHERACRCTSGRSTTRQAAAMLDLGVDGIMTDRPAMLRELLEKRGQWAPR